jgi:hypothetical protein
MFTEHIFLHHQEHLLLLTTVVISELMLNMLLLLVEEDQDMISLQVEVLVDIDPQYQERALGVVEV